ncbi:MAG: hypothetical protein ABW139_19740 [Candidatus Thiodiazotropha sp. DIVDIV]
MLDTNILSALTHNPQGLVAERIDLILSTMEILPLETPADQQYTAVRHHLTRQGTHIERNDLLIAAHALANDLMVVIANVSELSRLHGLKEKSGYRTSHQCQI